jgi:hypothetical protein
MSETVLKELKWSKMIQNSSKWPEMTKQFEMVQNGEMVYDFWYELT